MVIYSKKKMGDLYVIISGISRYVDIFTNQSSYSPCLEFTFEINHLVDRLLTISDTAS